MSGPQEGEGERGISTSPGVWESRLFVWVSAWTKCVCVCVSPIHARSLTTSRHIIPLFSLLPPPRPPPPICVFFFVLCGGEKKPDYFFFLFLIFSPWSVWSGSSLSLMWRWVEVWRERETEEEIWKEIIYSRPPAATRTRANTRNTPPDQPRRKVGSLIIVRVDNWLIASVWESVFIHTMRLN